MAAIPPNVGVVHGPILETDYVNQRWRGTKRGQWTKAVADAADRGPGPGNTWMEQGGPEYAWLNLFDTDVQYDTPLVGLSGTVVDKPHVSSSDFPFVHPFGNDFEFLVAPDPQYQGLAGPDMTDPEYAAGVAAATAAGLNVAGVVGMEMDSGQVPAPYRAKQNDRVCLWGRWIVDAGHGDFHTEIHPPLIMVNARGVKSSQQGAGAPGGPNDATVANIITRAYLMDQDFGDGGMLKHLEKEIAKALGLASLRVEAQPRLFREPFVGLNIVTFKVRPPTPRQNLQDKLFVELALTRRDDSVAIQVLPGTDGESVRVVMVLNAAGYNAPAEPPRKTKSYSRAQLEALSADVATIMKAVLIGALLINPVGAAVLAKGVLTHVYDPLPVPALPNPTRMPVAQMHPVPVPIDSSQPFPVAGTIKVEWQRFVVGPGPGPVPVKAAARKAPAKKAAPRARSVQPSKTTRPAKKTAARRNG